jgi:hypothetical protein
VRVGGAYALISPKFRFGLPGPLARCRSHGVLAIEHSENVSAQIDCEIRSFVESSAMQGRTADRSLGRLKLEPSVAARS